MDILATEMRTPVQPGTHGEVALQALEVLLLHLVEKGVVDAETLVAEIDSLATVSLEDCVAPRSVTVGGRLASLAQSIAVRSGRDD